LKRLVIIIVVLILCLNIIPDITIITVENGFNGAINLISSSDAKEYVVELRNINISYDMNLLIKSNLTENEYEKMFVNTSMSGLGKAFADAESETGVNGIYLASLGCLESSFGRSNFAQTRNNLFGYQSYDSNLDATKVFNSQEEGIVFVAQKIKKNYLTQSGAYHSGYTIASISKRYASDKEHANKIYSIMKKLINKL
jgi:beta-N-acetylglucosaminidase